jgi:hypothetical protein
VVLAGFALLAVGLAVTLTDSAPRSADSNHVAQVEPVAQLDGDGRRCQEGELVPKDASALRLLVGTYGRPAPEIRVTDRLPDGQLVTAGRLPAGEPEGTLDIPVRRVSKPRPDTAVCVVVAGTGRTVLYGGGGVLHLEWLRPGSESWIELLPTVAHRFALGKWNPIGSLLLPMLILVLLATWFAAARLVLRETRS